MDASKLISALGGTTAVASMLGVKPPAVSNWKATGLIPSKWYLRLAQEATSRGVAISPSAFSNPAPVPPTGSGNSAVSADKTAAPAAFSSENGNG
jgi:hypothetical protein